MPEPQSYTNLPWTSVRNRQGAKLLANKVATERDGKLPTCPTSAQSVMQAIGTEHPTFNEGLNHFYCRSCHHNTRAPFPFDIPR